MNWFERHLNWTAVITYFTTLVLWILLIQINLGGYSFHDYFYYMRPNYGLLPFIALLVVSYGLLYLNFLVFLWILNQKGQSYKHLISLVLVAFFFVLGFLLPEAEFDLVPKFWILFSLAIFTISWIILMSLYNWSKRRKEIYNSDSTPFVVPGYVRFFTSKYSRRFVFPCVIVIMLLVSIFSGLYLRFGYSTFKYIPEENSTIPEFSFIYPADLYNLKFSGLSVVSYSPSFFLNLRQREGWFQKIQSSLCLFVYDFSNINGDFGYPSRATHKNYSFEEKVAFYLDHPVWGFKLTLDQQILTTTIGDKSVKYFTIKYEQNINDMHNTSSINYCFIESRNQLWIFQMWNSGKIPPQLPAFLVRMLESFKIYDE